VVPVFALIAGLVATPVAMRVARRTRLVDRPGPLKVHEKPVPYLGGVGVAAALVVGLVPTKPSLLVPLLAALALGVADDAVELNPVVRLGGEAAIGVTVGLMIPLWEPRILGVVFATALTVVLCNSVNMVDGLDGLAGGVSLVSALGFFAVLSGDPATISISLAAGVAAFLAFNFPPASVYLGDGGAYLIGTALASLFLLTCLPGSGASFDVALLLVGYPLIELIFAVVRRMAEGQSPLWGDRQHLYDQLHERGASAGLAAALCVLLQGALVVVGVVVAPHSEATRVYVAGACGMMILAAGVLGGFAAPDTRRQ